MNILCKWFGHHWVFGYWSYLWDIEEWNEFDSPICSTCRHKKSELSLPNPPKYCV